MSFRPSSSGSPASSGPHSIPPNAAIKTNANNQTNRSIAYSTSIESNASSVMNDIVSPQSLGHSVDGGGIDSEPSLEARELRLQAMLAESELKHAELSERMMDVYEKQGEKLSMLRMMEKTLSSQAGSLLKRLQSEEQSTSSLSTVIKRYKNEHKKLLAKIANPKWEIAHHYHMTCIEHQLGHRQPHVLDVAELLPGHLRIYSLARVSSLYKRALMYYSAKSKADRNSVSESIQESYKRLREVRKDMKEIAKMMDLMKVHMKKAAAEGSGPTAVRIPKMERQDSGERTFDPTTPSSTDNLTSPIAAAASSETNFAPSPSPSIPPSATRRPPSGGAGGPGSADALMRQRRRMLGMGGPGGHLGGPGQSSRGGPGAARNGTFMGAGTPVSGTTSSGTTAPSNNPLAPLNPDAIVLPTDGTSFAPLSTTPTNQSTHTSSSLATSSTSSSLAASLSSSSSPSQSNYRMKYFKTLNLAPKLDFLSTNLPTTSPDEARKDMAESYNMDMKNIHVLLQSLEATGKASKEKAQQLTLLQQYRKRMGVESLPTPHFDANGQLGGALDAPNSPSVAGMGEDSDTEGGGEHRRNGSSSQFTIHSPGTSPGLSPLSPNQVGSGNMSGTDDFSLDGLSIRSPTSPSTSSSNYPSYQGDGSSHPHSSSHSHFSTSEPSSPGVHSDSSPVGSAPSSPSRPRERRSLPSAPVETPTEPAQPVTLFSSRGPGAQSNPKSSSNQSNVDAQGRSHSSRATSNQPPNRSEDHGR